MIGLDKTTRVFWRFVARYQRKGFSLIGALDAAGKEMFARGFWKR